MPFSNSTYIFLLFLASFVGVHGICENMTHITFYMHGQVSGPNPSSIRVVNGTKPIPILPRLHFGDIYVYDDLLTKGPTPDSTPIGRAQAFYPVAAQDKPVFIIVMNVAFTSGEYNGSMISILGGDDIFAAVRELSVIGGTGDFRMARGYVIWKTFTFNSTSGDAVLKLDVCANKFNAEEY